MDTQHVDAANVAAEPAAPAPAPVIPNNGRLWHNLFPTLLGFLTMEISTKRSGKFFLDFIWYVFIMLVVGQLGVVLAIGIAFWEGTSIWLAILQQANSGNFLTFSVALLAGSGYFMIREFHGDDGIKRPYFKSPLLLLSIAVGFTGALVSASLAKSPATVMTEFQLFWHWMLYWACIALSLLWWTMEEMQGSVKDLGDEVTSNSKALTEKSKSKSTQTRAKMRV